MTSSVVIKSDLEGSGFRLNSIWYCATL